MNRAQKRQREKERRTKMRVMRSSERGRKKERFVWKAGA